MADDQEQDIFGENQTTSKEPVEDKLFGETSPTEISLDDEKEDEINEDVLPDSKPVVLEKSKPPSARKTEEELEEEGGDSFDINIKVSDPTKVGDGMSAYIAYIVTTQTSIPFFKSSDLSVKRRFSDFLGLYERLNEKHLLNGRIVPPPPDKSVVGMVRVKGSKDDQSSTDFVEKRQKALERFLNRVSRHKELVGDPDFKEFLEAEELPRAKNTSALSKGGLSRLAKGIGEAVSKMTTKMVESDSWFETKQNQIENLDQQLKKLHLATETLVTLRKDVVLNTASFSKSCSLLSNAEEHTGLSKALSQLAELEEKIEHIQDEQVVTDYFLFSESLKEYIGLIAAVKAVFNQRCKVWSNWQSAEVTLNKKRQVMNKLELQGKADKVPAAKEEVHEWERRVESGEEEFKNISEAIKIEMVRFEKMRVHDFKNLIIGYLESLLLVEQEFVKLWEGFNPEAKAICS